jgi:hypothetical protein
VALRKTDLIRAPQHAPPTNELCHYTCHGLAPATQSRAAQRAHGRRRALRPGHGTRTRPPAVLGAYAYLRVSGARGHAAAFCDRQPLASCHVRDRFHGAVGPAGILDHLPERQRPWVQAIVRRAYHCDRRQDGNPLAHRSREAPRGRISQRRRQRAGRDSRKR